MSDISIPLGHTAVLPTLPAARRGPGPDYAKRPMLVFWETTRACALACKHCRASATMAALPGELTTVQGKELIDQVAGFGRPYPILVLTGGDCLMRPDLFELVDDATGLGLPTALSPSVTPT
ncbi:MAG TPA: radical SAM protein, partial [Cryobacterium sp.]|nr:radical SAM protein [Cryobacterium sp.]